MNALFIATGHHAFCGGEVCTLRNLAMLQHVCGKEHVTEIRVTRDSSPKGVLLWYARELANDLTQCSVTGIDRKQRRQILQTIKADHIDVVFLDNSLLGLLAKEIRKECPRVRIICFFHNVEYRYYRQELHLSRKPLLAYRLPIVRRNEQVACRYADTLVVLNQRDARTLQSLYGRQPDYIIPITLPDTFPYPTPPTTQTERDRRKQALFVGSYFTMNVEGITHFIRNILPHTDISLTVAGSGMGRLKEQLGKPEGVTIHDYVPDLSQLYAEADFVIAPIYSGSGMKVKTAEAMMHGKHIIGTPEAFTGYDILPDAATVCPTDADFIEAINRYDRPPHCQAARQLFTDRYSYDHSAQLFARMLAP